MKNYRAAMDAIARTARAVMQSKTVKEFIQYVRPTWVFRIGAAAFLVIGQGFILTGHLERGIGWTIAGLILAGLGFIKDAYFIALLHTCARVIKKTESLWEKVRPVQTRKAENDVHPVLLETKTEAEPEPENLEPGEREWEHRVAGPEPVKVFFPKAGIFVLAGILLAIGQPLVLWHRYYLAVFCLVFGLAGIAAGWLIKEKKIYIGTIRSVVGTLALGLPGAGLMVIGTLILSKYVSLNLPKEILGIGLNAAGAFMLIALFPNRMPGSNPDPGEVMDNITGRPHGPKGFALRLGMVLLAGVLMMLAPGHWESGGTSTAVWLVIVGLGVLVWSFPLMWKKPAAEIEPRSPLWRTLVMVLRMAAFAMALYFGYQGQSLIAQEKLYPGLIRFLFAVTALTVAFREPDPGVRDSLKEKPLAWYWEMLGLLVIMGFGAWLRYRLLDVMPYGIECDEAAGGVHAKDILAGHFQSLTAHPVGQPLFMLLPKVVSMRFLGDGSLGIRFMSAFWGVASILTMYLFARHFYGPRVAMGVAALVCLSRWHLHFSRFGFSNALFIVLLMLGFYFLVKGISSRLKWHMVFSGITFALALQTETAARLIPFICIAILGYFVIFRTRFLTKNWKLGVLLVLGVWIAGANILMFWAGRSNMMSRRVSEVSIFSEDPNAPRDVAKGFVTSLKLSMAQMNWHGDTRTRHNGGMSGEPLLNFWTAIMFVLGFGFSIYYWKRFRYFLPLIWFFGFMSASIFAIEAPQSHRAFGLFPTIYLFIGAFLDRSRRLLRESLGRVGTVIGIVAFIIILIPIGRSNFKKYFDTFPGFDTSCTAAAKFMGKQYPDAEHYIMTAYLWQGHPPFQLYARDISGKFYYASSEVVPLREVKDKTAVFTFLLEYQPVLESIQWYYPNGKYFEEDHPRFGRQFRSWVVAPKEIERTRGLEASFWGDGNPKKKQVLKNPQEVMSHGVWPMMDEAGTAELDGTVFIPHEGDFRWYLRADDWADITIGDKVRLRSGQGKEIQNKVWLAGGLHPFHARFHRRKPGDTVSLEWSCDREPIYYMYNSPYKHAFNRRAVANEFFYTYEKPVGLMGTFYQSDHWQGPILQQRIEPVLLFVWMGSPFGFEKPLSADWRGSIQIDEPGEYRFDLRQDGFGEVEIDGQVVYSSGTRPASVPVAGNLLPKINLTRGMHRITVRWVWQNQGILQFYWTPPQKPREIVPARVLSPAAE